MLKWSIPIGRVFGIRLYLHWSLLVTLGLITTLLAGSVLPTEYAGRSPVEYWSVGALAAVVFVLSLAAHEVAHSVVAVHDGVPVRRITLWLLGGMSELQGEPADPRTELRITLAGPLTSLAIGVASLLLVAVLPDTTDPVLAASLAWLGVANVILAVFNLLPGAPLDGGRVLHAVLWRRRGDRLSAAAGAARSGRFLGLALIALGAAQAVFAQSLGGLWLMLLGWFLRSAANVELMTASMRHQLGDLQIRRIMTRSPVAAPADEDVDTFVRDVLPRLRHHTFPVVDESYRPVGVLSLRDLTRAGDRTGSVAGLARPLPDTARVHPDARVETVISTAVLRPGLDLLAVVGADGRLVGIVTATDLRRVCERTSLGLPLAPPPDETG
ncbi:Zn-dependent protease/CBS domain-containing protein [Rhodococcus sp. LBL1]|uniref:Zinc metalloprotease n=1 Tax=Prescottella agglutinans TaxID=1644129 RepID=A0ABT6MDU1_9NOCA|nr:site-2 protease family protein [Prescottella agglutinans]MDH6282484.1 Zn-dependent protease/CBS domain-containing protein [Prescottella agglutinans]MDH6679077.1 Zn-dependent protease/CBS domain-containing protein [Rhodococcus sp. LBL1]MDH6685183.1 Zn-dependent protease/CBS domain-containing protein [Rhodococcus sp. LBL2]